MIRVALSAAAVAALLSACSSTPPASPSARLENAPIKASLACSGVRPLSVQQPLATLPLSCQGMDKEMTLPEVQDAGWRLDTVQIGKTRPGDREIPVRLTFRKTL